MYQNVTSRLRRNRWFHSNISCASRNERSYVICPSPLLVQTRSLPRSSRWLEAVVAVAATPPGIVGLVPIEPALQLICPVCQLHMGIWVVSKCFTWSMPKLHDSPWQVQLRWLTDSPNLPCSARKADISGKTCSKPNPSWCLHTSSLLTDEPQPAQGPPKPNMSKTMTLQSPMCFCVLQGLILSTLWRMQSHVLRCLRPEDRRRKAHTWGNPYISSAIHGLAYGMINSGQFWANIATNKMAKCSIPYPTNWSTRPPTQTIVGATCECLKVGTRMYPGWYPSVPRGCFSPHLRSRH